MKILSRGLPAAVLAVAVAAVPASAATVTVRVEGATKTLVAAQKVTIPDAGQIPEAESGCLWNEQSGALHAGTGGKWDRKSFVQEILGERYEVSDDTGWFAWTDGKYGNGICNTEIRDGAEVLFMASKFDADYNPVALPLSVRDVPARVEKGAPFTVTVLESVPEKGNDAYYDPGTGTLKPAAGVTVTAAGASATTDANGKATLRVEQTGPTAVQARRGTGAARSDLVPTCIGCDPKPAPASASAAAPAATPAPACLTTGLDGFCGSFDRQAPKALVTSIRSGRVFTSGPRELAGRAGVLPPFARRDAALVADPSGLLAVKLRLTRNDRGRCSTFSGRSERFVARRCGASRGTWFAIGDRTEWSYLLPSALPRGRYVLDVNAIDKAYNRDDARRRGENRVVFTVR